MTSSLKYIWVCLVTLRWSCLPGQNAPTIPGSSKFHGRTSLLWLVFFRHPSEKWWSKSQLGWWHSQYMIYIYIYGKIKFMFQSTNQRLAGAGCLYLSNNLSFYHGNVANSQKRQPMTTGLISLESTIIILRGYHRATFGMGFEFLYPQAQHQIPCHSVFVK